MKRLLALLALVSACRVVYPPPTPGGDDAGPPQPVHDAALESAPPPDGTPCERAWQRITALSCAVTVPRTGTWSEACTNGEANGIAMGTACVTAAADCPTIRRCLGEK
jgi:hypothetical protein